LAVSVDVSVATLLQSLGVGYAGIVQDHALLRLTVSQLAPTLPYWLLILVLVCRPRSLSCTR